MKERSRQGDNGRKGKGERRVEVTRTKGGEVPETWGDVKFPPLRSHVVVRGGPREIVLRGSP